jgi:hypothetical protein
MALGHCVEGCHVQLDLVVEHDNVSHCCLVRGTECLKTFIFVEARDIIQVFVHFKDVEHRFFDPKRIHICQDSSLTISRNQELERLSELE